MPEKAPGAWMPADRQIDLHFPKAGIDLSKRAGEWPRRESKSGEVHYTCAEGVNVRGFEALTLRHRGGSRPGLVKYVAGQVRTDWVIQDINLLVGTGYDAPGGGLQGSNSGRIVTLVAVSKGQIRVANPGDSTWIVPTNSAANNPPLNASGVIFSAPNQQKLYFVDGLDDHVLYNPATNTISDWTATAGTFPVDADGNGPRLICLWRGRIVLSGLFGDPQNIFMTAVDAPTNFNYSPASPSATQAVALNLSDLGMIGDVVTGLVPSTDDVLVVLGDHTIYKITGDPASNGVVDLVSDAIGAAWGQAWCKGPDGTIYFFSNVPGVYALPAQAAGQPVRISHAIDPLLEDVDTGNSTIRLNWDDRYKGFHVFITPSSSATNTASGATHYFFEAPRPDGSGNAWWQDEFANTDHNPLCCCTVDGNEADDRVVVIGSWDGYVRSFDPQAATDDGETITSHVMIGPLLTPNMDEVRLKSLQAVLAEDSADVDYEVRLGKTAEEAINATGVVPDTFSELRGYTKRVNRAAHAIYVRLSSTGRWAMESIRAGLSSTLSAVRRRRNG